LLNNINVKITAVTLLRFSIVIYFKMSFIPVTAKLSFISPVFSVTWSFRNYPTCWYKFK